ncbi:MAG TPA: hypothetical protein VF228_02080 [Iamia sp.]
MRWGPNRAPVDAGLERWVVGPVRTTTAADGWRGIEADVDGTPVRIEARDVELVPRPEAIATAVAPAAAVLGAQLVLEEPVDAGWWAGVEQAAGMLATWHDATPVRPAVVAPRTRAPRPRRRAVPPGVAQCFTGGVDSFWTLRHGGVAPSHLVYVVGFDVPLDDTARVADQLATLDAVAAAAGGQRPLAVRSDLRSHPHANRVTWGWLHGGALAGVGHALAGVVGTLVIPPSNPEGRLMPLGSHPALDPLWSRPGALAIRHCSTTLPRVERLRALVDDPLAQAHLHVCWEHREPGPNCGRCEKCLRTMAMLAGLGALDRFGTFPAVEDMPAAIATLGPMGDLYRNMWADVLDLPLPPALHDVVRTVLLAPVT